MCTPDLTVRSCVTHNDASPARLFLSLRGGAATWASGGKRIRRGPFQGDAGGGCVLLHQVDFAFRRRAGEEPPAQVFLRGTKVHMGEERRVLAAAALHDG